MKIKALNKIVYNGGIHEKDAVFEVDAKTAESLVESGAAEVVEVKKTTKKTSTKQG